MGFRSKYTFFSVVQEHEMQIKTLTSQDYMSVDSLQQSQAYIAFLTVVNDKDWFLDSGATHHVTTDGGSLPTKTKYSGIAKLAIGYGSILPVSIDTVKIHALKPLILKNILLIPAITKNLIIISKFTMESNVIVVFNYLCCLVKDSQLKTILRQGFIKDGLYQLHLPSTSNESAHSHLCSSPLTYSNSQSGPCSYSVFSFEYISCNAASSISCSSCTKYNLINLLHN